MIVNSIKYTIKTKEFPTQFDSAEYKGKLVDNIEEAYLYENSQQARHGLKDFDNPKNYQVLKVAVRYEF